MRILFFFAFSLIFFSTLWCEEDNEKVSVVEEALPRLPSVPKKEAFPVLIEKGKGLVLVGNPKDLLSGDELDNVRGLKVIGIKIPGKPWKLEKHLNALVVGKQITKETIYEIKTYLATYYKDAHHPLVLVEVPEQDITSGVLQLIVLESRLGEIRIEGNKWTSSKRLMEYIQLRPAQEIDEGRLMNDVHFINRNPFRRVDIVYAPGEEPNTTDVILAVKERRPWRIYSGVENTGVEPIGRGRWLLGFNWGNVFGLGHVFSYQFTSSYNPHRFKAHTVEYLAPLPWRHVLDVYGGYSEVHPKIHRPIRRNKGWSAQASLRYTIPLRVYRYLEHEIDMGFDFKRMNNTFEFTEDLPLFGRNVNLTQFILGYTGNYERNTYRLDFDGDIYWSPGQWLADQTNNDYESLRPDAKNHWVYFRGSFVYLQRLPKSFSLSLLARGQISSQNLLPSEQFGLGGYDTVRGYDQREVNKDGAILLSAEARSPALPLLKYIKSQWKIPDRIQFLIFLDYGWGANHNALPGEPKSEYLLGTGPGIRYTIEPYLSARLDWGIKLHKKAQYGGGNTMINFAIIASY